MNSESINNNFELTNYQQHLGMWVNVFGSPRRQVISPHNYLTCYRKSTYKEFCARKNSIKSLQSMAYEVIIHESYCLITMHENPNRRGENTEENIEKRYQQMFNTYLTLNSIYIIEKESLKIRTYNFIWDDEDKSPFKYTIQKNYTSYIQILRAVWNRKNDFECGLTIISQSCKCASSCVDWYETYF